MGTSPQVYVKPEGIYNYRMTGDLWLVSQSQTICPVSRE